MDRQHARAAGEREPVLTIELAPLARRAGHPLAPRAHFDGIARQLPARFLPPSSINIVLKAYYL